MVQTAYLYFGENKGAMASFQLSLKPLNVQNPHTAKIHYFIRPMT